MVGRGGGVLQLQCESGNIIEYLENKLIGEGHTHPYRLPHRLPRLGRRGSDQPGSQDVCGDALPDLRGASVHATGPGAHQTGAEPGPARVDGNLPAIPAAVRRADGRFRPLAKIGPPLRPEDGPDRDALWQGLRQGNVSIVASDHSPHPRELKQPGWDNIFVDSNGTSIPFGSPGIETIVPLMYSEGVVKRGLPIWWLARVMAENPARIFGIYPRKGVIQSVPTPTS